MDNNKLAGRIFQQSTTGTKKANGLWQIDVLIKETLIFPDGTKKEESIETMAVDEDFDTAHSMAVHSGLNELGELVYSRQFDSLIEAREYDRSKKDDSTKASSTEITQ